MKYKVLLLIIILVNATGMLGGIMEPDGALYAYIAKQMAQHNDFINLYNSTDWLDKPHFPFWVIAISFKIFGVSSFAYKLPAFLFWLAGTGYLYKLGKEVYNKQTAIIAVLIYTTALQGVIALFDVRAEHYLTALTIAAIYYLYKVYTTGKLKFVWLAALFSACAVMTKGIFFLSSITSGLGIMILVAKEWRQFSNYRWYIYLLLTLLFILPELYCLYVQFDLHPEKIVYGQTCVSGIRFFFWDSQFGRFLNTGPIKGKGDPFFFFHTALWTFLPWSILLYAAVVRLMREKKVIYHPAQWIILGSAAFTFLIFSLSKFQLPHYLIVLFPQFALISADYLVNKQHEKGIHTFFVLQRILLAAAAIAVATVAVVFDLPDYFLIVITVLLIAALFFFMTKKKSLSALVTSSIGFFVIIHLFLNLSFYPALLQYESGMVAAKWLNTSSNSSILHLFNFEDYSFKFYADKPVVISDSVATKSASPQSAVYYFMKKQDADSCISSGTPIVILQSFQNSHISKLTPAFLLKRTRYTKLDTTMIVRSGR